MDQKWQDYWKLRIGLEPTVLVPEKSALHQNLQNSIANSIVWSTVGPEVPIKEKNDDNNFSWAKNGPSTTFFIHLNNTKFEWFFLATRYLFSVKSTQEDLNFSWSLLFWPPHVFFLVKSHCSNLKREREKKKWDLKYIFG